MITLRCALGVRDDGFLSSVLGVAFMPIERKLGAWTEPPSRMAASGLLEPVSLANFKLTIRKVLLRVTCAAVCFVLCSVDYVMAQTPLRFDSLASCATRAWVDRIATNEIVALMRYYNALTLSMRRSAWRTASAALSFQD